VLPIRPLSPVLEDWRFVGQSLPARSVKELVASVTPDAKQAEVLNGDARRVLLNCCRQWGKSTTAAMLAARRVMEREKTLVVCVSPTLRQTAEFVLKVKGVLVDAGVRVRGGRLELVAENGARVLGVPGQDARVRGYSAPSLVIVDEAAKVEENAYRALRPMLAVGRGDLVMMSTPYGQRGFFWKEWSGRGGEWRRVEVRATDCPRIPAEFLEEEKKVQGEEWFAQEYLCSFVAMQNQAFRVEWLENAKMFGLDFRALDWEGFPSWMARQPRAGGELHGT
jgi:Terminase large subunit, T4likevirus-type, N-terminal